MKNSFWKKASRFTMLLGFGLCMNQIVFAQQTKPLTPPQQTPPAIPPQHVPPVPNQTQPGQQDWQSFQQDMQTKYLRMTTQIDSLKSAAASKKIDDPMLNDAFSKFQSAAQDFNQLLQSGDKVSPDQFASLKSQLTDQFSDLTAARDHVLDVYSKIGGG